MHVNITEHPTAERTAPHVVEAFPWDHAPQYLLKDCDRTYSASFQQQVRPIGIEDAIIAPRSPWQNLSAEQLIGSIRRDGLDHNIVLHERHLDGS